MMFIFRSLSVMVREMDVNGKSDSPSRPGASEDVRSSNFAGLPRQDAAGNVAEHRSDKHMWSSGMQ